MPFRKDTSVRQRAHLLLESHWRPDAVAKDARCSRATAYRWERNLAIYGDTVIPRRYYSLGRSKSITPTALNAMLKYQRQHPYLYQDELARYLREEWEIDIHKSTIYRALKKAGISHKKGQRISDNQSNELRVA